MTDLLPAIGNDEDMIARGYTKCPDGLWRFRTPSLEALADLFDRVTLLEWRLRQSEEKKSE